MLLCKNVVVNGRRTSMRLDRETWQALSDICKRENISLYKLCSLIDDAKQESGLSSATRLFVLTYYRRSLAKYETGIPQTPPATPSRRVEQVLNVVRAG
ncbi:MAG: ribbon-helix-helix domain-containing protein [Alphaproteobacteria bacterium]|nr:ribbon-helix-helix domain-containing protein [Alphaproteobacteria bacterium]MBQ4084267.1 ribbon-helix-helix domain-containing protein [Alphaproteobacteria bacterium]